MQPYGEIQVLYTCLFQEMTDCNQLLCPQGNGTYHRALVSEHSPGCCFHCPTWYQLDHLVLTFDNMCISLHPFQHCSEAKVFPHNTCQKIKQFSLKFSVNLQAHTDGLTSCASHNNYCIDLATSLRNFTRDFYQLPRK